MPQFKKRMVTKMANLWWKKKNEPAEEWDNAYYGGESTSTSDESSDAMAYGTYDGGDISEVSVAWSEEEARAIKRANEPLMKKTYTPKTCQDSTSIVDAYKDGRVVVICVEELDKENFLRLFDYVMGAVHALDGKLSRIDRDTVLLLPYGVEEDEVSVDELEEAEDDIAADVEEDSEDETED